MKQVKDILMIVFLTFILIFSSLSINKVFSSQEHNNSFVNILEYIYVEAWKGVELLPDPEAQENCEELEYALNNPNSESGKSLTKAINNRRNNTDYIGNMDNKNQVITNLDNVLSVPDDCSYVIKIRDDGYDLYMTYEDLSSYSYGNWVSPVYKTTYRYNSTTGLYDIVESQVGSAKRNIYYIANPRPCIDTESFKTN